jgi:hypothetical protein
MPQSSTLRRTLFAAGVLGCLGFGSAQAFAAPRAAAAPAALCNDTVCAAGCIAKGYWGGYCTQTSGCYCYRLETPPTP